MKSIATKFDLCYLHGGIKPDRCRYAQINYNNTFHPASIVLIVNSIYKTKQEAVG